MRVKNGLDIYYDGTCNLCTLSVQIAKPLNTHNTFLDATATLLPEGVTSDEAMRAMYVIDSSGIQHVGAAGILKILESNPFTWIFAKIGTFPPILFVLDKIYAVVARNRYRWFGKIKINHD